ncbi:hypothetical protein LAZ40_16565 [Cereibacter sphaeroides]|uniref:hypothetical protein n=1 Tax=Cereibacter sphaeroides TaxID=1063 RepID=UPI001F1DAC87|nr:hypothetical protein [Cereibacter sphaeroides]MCE6951315.1 hypothetical protein [Cereibacter sphaeroides]MCE6960640.1 hypothetical protein [Cereibacter sphaeroides]MCE6970093.1 hypothetical protein [Cereibacter sphaeroides]MCE6973258.1 hypothetical protein [Cereibacter sphaeroides]
MTRTAPFDTDRLRGRDGMRGNRPAGPVWSLHLVNRETGDVLRLNGMPLVIYTRDASEGLAALLEDRDPRLWRAEVSQVTASHRTL